MTGKLSSIAAFAVLSMLATASQATTYNGIRNFGAGLTGALTIETDGTQGVLGASNILDVSLRLSGLDEENAAKYGDHPIIETTAPVLSGTSLWATHKGLFFDFDHGDSTFGVDGGAFYILQSLACNLCQSGTEFLELDAEYSLYRPQSGVQLLATVPEPASWAMLITGFGLVGAAQRRRRTALHPV